MWERVKWDLISIIIFVYMEISLPPYLEYKLVLIHSLHISNSDNFIP